MDSISIGNPYAEPKPGQERPEFPTLLHMLADATEKVPDRTALICGDDSLTYEEYGRCVTGLKKELEALGARGQRIAVTMTNSNEALIACFGTLAAGAQVSFLNPFYTERELLPLLQDVDAHILICHQPYTENVLPIAEKADVAHTLIFGGEGNLSLGQWRDDESLALTGPFPAPGDPASLVYTGGTTGVPKAVEHTHEENIKSAVAICGAWPTELDQDVWVNAAPVSHIWAILVGCWCPIYYRGTVLTIEKFVPDEMVAQMELHKATVLCGGPAAFYNGLMSASNFADANLSSLRLCFGGGSPFPLDTLNGWDEKVGVPILESYGMSEIAPVSSNRVGGVRKIGSVGQPHWDTEIQIVDLESGNDIIPVGEAGEIRVRGPHAMKKYRNRPEETKIAVRDDWIYTGDIGRLDEDGFLYILDRKKEIVIVGGYNVFPREIEEILFSHATVQDAAAIGVPDDYKGEVIWAYVVLKSDSRTTEQEFLDLCAENLVTYKRPVGITISNELPKTPANKPDKNALLDLHIKEKRKES